MNTSTPHPPEGEETWSKGVGHIENAHVQQFLFLIILLMLIAAGVQGLNLIDKPGDPSTHQAIAYVGLSVIGCLFAYVLTLQQRTMAAAAVAVVSLTVPIFLHAWGSGIGIRAPIIYLWTPPILLAYYVLDFRLSLLLTLSACAAAIFLYVLEAQGEINGYDGAALALSANNLIVLWLVVICGLAAANAIRERKEVTLTFAQNRRALLQRALADIELAEASQRQFMQQVSGTVAEHASNLHRLANPGNTGVSTQGDNPVKIDAQTIAAESKSMMQALDLAVEQTERETRFFLDDSLKRD